MDCCVLFVVAWNENEMPFARSLVVLLRCRNIHHLILQSKESVVVVVFRVGK